jgi:outer membrane receptor for ferrienterochelin and colicin
MSNVQFLLPLFFLPFSLLAQTGTIKGTIKDGVSTEGIIGASILLEGTSQGALTDIEGNFIIDKVYPGTYTIVLTSIGYQTSRVSNLVVEAGKVINVRTTMQEAASELGEITIVGQRATNTDISVISEIKLAQQIAVGVSAQQIVRSQDRDAAQIARRVPGVSIVDNRFVLVRGLGQRYNAVMINDVLAPSSEVDTRAFSFDMIPSNMIDRMIIYKSGSADLPGEFAGGVIKIYTKRAPEENFSSVSISGSYRSNTTFKSFKRYQKGSLDFLGFDDGSRQIPNGIPTASSTGGALVPLQAQKFENTWPLKTFTVAPDFRLQVNLGRRFDVGDVQIGNLTGINYTSSHQFNSNGKFNLFVNDKSRGAGAVAVDYTDSLYAYNTRIGLIHNWSFRFNPSFTLEFKNLYNQLGYSETLLRQGEDIDNNNIDVRIFSQRFESRGIYSGQLLGRHTLSDKINLNWVGGFSYIRRDEPDWKRVKYVRSRGTQDPFLAATFAQITDAARFYSQLNEYVYTGSVNAEYNLNKNKNNDDGSKIKIGAYIEQKNRDFTSRTFGINSSGASSPSIGQIRQLPVGSIFEPANFIEGLFRLEETTRIVDKYEAYNRLYAGYISATVGLFPRINLTTGTRLEYNSQGIQVESLIDEQKNVLSVLPSANLSYELNDKQLVRLAYSYTVNRPELREIAPFIFYDVPLNANIAGNERLKTARIQNLDARWEFYPSPSELILIGVFYKSFKDPIETFQRVTGNLSVLDYTYINTQSATNYGAEAEIRKSFSELSNRKFFQNLTAVANASFIYSNVQVGDFVVISETLNPEPIPTKDVVASERLLTNQSPYLINAGLYYSDEAKGWQVNLLYNVYGRRLYAVGSALVPDTYEMPRQVLDANVSKTFNEKLEIRLAVQDMLNQRFRLEQDYSEDGRIDDNDRQTLRQYRRGVYTTLSLTLNF